MPGKRTLLSWMIDTGRLGRAITRLAWSRRLSGAGYAVLVLNYHRIGPSRETPFDRGCFSATAEQFEQHLRHLRRRCTLIGLDQLDAILDPDGPPPPKRPVLLTFDDGYADNYHLAFPLLQKYDATAVFFPTTDFVDRKTVAWWDEIAWLIRRLPPGTLELPAFRLTLSLPGPAWSLSDSGHGAMAPDGSEPRGRAIQQTLERYKQLPADEASQMVLALRERAEESCPLEWLADLYMTWDQLREMQNAGMTIGGHTLSHPVLARLDRDRQRQEIAGCRDRIGEMLGEKPSAFSYPVGRPGTFDQGTEDLVAEAGFRWAFQFYGDLWRIGRDRSGNRARLSIPRMPVHDRAKDHEFRTQLAWPRLFNE